MLHREGAAGFKSESNEREKVSSDAPGLSATSANKPALFRSTSAAPVIRPISASTACLTVVPGDAPRSARSTSESVSAGHLRHPFGSGSSDAHPMLQGTGAFDEGFMDLEADGVEQHAERVASLLLTGGHADTSRPLPPLLSTLVDAAHYASSTEGRTTAYPHTYAYAMFKWRVAETAADAGSDAGSLAARSMRDDRQSHGSHDSADTSAARAAPGSTNSALPRRSLASSLRSAARTEGSQTLAPGAPAPATDLEVVALYDANFQAANRLGQHGVQGLRGVSAPSIGPISYAYRWYCKRATQFVGACTHAHVPDAPALPASAAASGGVDGEVDGVTTSGRVLNRSLDPVMSERELLDMLEELEVVPQLITRPDVATIFKLSRESGSTAAVHAAANGSSRTSSSQHVTTTGPTCEPADPAALRAPMQAIPLPPGRLGGSGLAGSAAGSRPYTGGSGRAYGGSSNGGGGGRGSNRRLTDSEDVTVSALGVSVTSRRSRGSSPCSMPAVGFSSSSSSSTAGVAGGGGGQVVGYGYGPAVPRPLAQPRPEEIRYPDFLDALIRIALAAHAREHARQQALLAPALQAAGADSESARAAAEARAFGQALTRGQAEGALVSLLRHMGFERSNMQGLKQKLDALARMSGEKGARVNALKSEYMSGESALTAVQRQGLTVSTGADTSASSAAGAAGDAGSWSPLSPLQAPSLLHAMLLESDRSFAGEYRPVWCEFGCAALELGLVEPGERRACRLLLHNRGVHAMHVRLDSNAAPFASCTHAGLNKLLPGVPRTVEVNVRLDAPGEVLGELRLYASTRWQPEEKMIVIPIYAIVGKASAVKRAPSARAERSVLAAKLAAEPKSMVAKSASLSPGLPHHTPPKRITSAAYTLSGFGITGSGASSTGFSSTGRSASTSMLGGSFSAAASGSFAVQGHGSMRASSAGYRTMRSSYEGEMALAASSSCQQLPGSFHSRQGDGGRMDTAQQEPMSCGSGLGSTSSGTSLCYQQYLRPAGSEAATPMQSPRSRTGSATSIQAQGQAYASAAVGASPARVLPPRPAGVSSAAAARASQNGGRSGLVGSSSSTRTSLELTPGSAAAAQVAHGSVAADEGGLHALSGPATNASGSRRTSVTWLDA